MNISRFTPPILWGKGLQIVKNEASKESHRRNHALSIALAILFLITNFFILNSCSSSDDDDYQKKEEEAFSHNGNQGFHGTAFLVHCTYSSNQYRNKC